jgi:membrane-bound lytic murein transglycosylase D
MQSFRTSLLLAAVASLVAAGCEDAARTSQHRNVAALHPEAQVRGQAAAPVESPVPIASLPLWTRDRQPPPSLVPIVLDDKSQLIEKVQSRFTSGEQNFKAGHLEAARRDFDAAVDLMLESGYDLEKDSKLRDLFHRVVDTVYSDELQAFQAGDGFQETPAVPAPIDEVAEMTFPVDPRLKDRAEEAVKTVSHDMPLTVNDEVLSFLNFFQTPRGKAIVEAGLVRSGRYREMIARILHEEGVPQDLIFLAQAESAFQPLALSRAGARGIWQFVPWRGNEYGLRRSWWVDERQDPEKATRAAAQHLRDLYGLFGDWYLAMAAYNCGPGNVQKGIERTGYADFWELYRRNVLPRETKNYVPIIVALTLIAKDAAHYGIQADLEKPVPSDVVKPGRAIDLRLVAETIDVDVETLRSLNPSLLRLATPDDVTFELHLPVGTAERFSAEIADIPPEKWVSWRRHRVEPGETLTALAKQYKVTAAAIAAANSLGSSTALTPGDKLIIPAMQPASETKGRLARYRVRKGDTLGGIADQFSVSTDELRKWNALKSARVSRGMILRVYTIGGAPEARPAPKRPAQKRSASGVKTAASSGSAGQKTP